MLGQGKQAAALFLKEKPDTAKKIVEEIMVKSKTSPAAVEVGVEDRDTADEGGDDHVDDHTLPPLQPEPDGLQGEAGRVQVDGIDREQGDDRNEEIRRHDPARQRLGQTGDRVARGRDDRRDRRSQDLE